MFGEARYLDAANRAATFIETRMYDPKANLLTRRYRHGEADIDALLEDYAFLIQGLLDLYEESFDVRWLSWVLRLQAQQDQRFWDAVGGGYFSTAATAPDILARFKDEYDGPEPSANSVSAMNLLRLWQVTGRQVWRDRADALFLSMTVRLTRSGTALPQLAVALDFSLSKPRQIVIAGRPGAPDTRAMLRLVHDRFIPNKILLLADGGAGQKQLAQWLPSLGSMRQLNGQATMFVCENYVCRLPTARVQTAAALLDGKRPWE